MRGLREAAPARPARRSLRNAKTCMYTNTPDEHFVIGRHPGHERVVVACGFSGHGFKFVPVVGEIVAELVAEDRTQQPIDLFDPGPVRRPMTAPSLLPTLPGRCYTDPDVFAAEQEPSSRPSGAAWSGPPTWPGRASSGPWHVGRESVIVIRGRGGALRAFLNVCRHRGARVCAEERGTVRRNFRCPTTRGPTGWTDGWWPRPTCARACPTWTATAYGLRTGGAARVAGLRLGVPGRRAAAVRAT